MKKVQNCTSARDDGDQAEPLQAETFDVFLCHNSQDKPAVRQIGERLKQRGLKPWIDVEQLRPGLPWQDALEEQIARIKAVAVFVGPNGRSPWQNLEMKAFLRQFAKRHCPVIPVILPECKETPTLPLFLEGMTWVDFRTSDPDPLQQLIWGITGERSFTAPPQPANQQKQRKTKETRKTPAISLRREPMTVSEVEFQEIFGLDNNGRPREYIANQYEDQGEVVVDHAAGLMWQKSGSENFMPYQDALKYIKELNRKQFAGYDDWRLPTIPELMSLLEPEEKENSLYIKPIFDKNQTWCWSADVRQTKGENSSRSAWSITFGNGNVDWTSLYDGNYVRAVRSRQ